MKQCRKNDQIINSRERSPSLPFVNCLRRIETENHLQVVNGQASGLPEIHNIGTGLCQINRWNGQLKHLLFLNYCPMGDVKAAFCNPASGNEKGLVEGLVGYSRRNTCVPVPRVDTMEELNRMFREKCQNYLSHQIRGKEASVGTMFAREKALLYPLPGYPFDPCKRASGRVDRFCTVRFDTNNYSVPAAYCGREVSIKAGPEAVSIYYEGQRIARHRRCLERKQNIYALEHYLPLLEKKGRAIFYARPVQDTLPEYFIQWLRKQELSPKELVEILRSCRYEDFNTIMA